MPEDFPGVVLEDGDPDYDEARRVFNGMIDRIPDRILRCSTTQDVAAAISAAVGPVARSRCTAAATGSPAPPSSTAALCIDLRGLDASRSTRTPRGAALRWAAPGGARSTPRPRSTGSRVTGGRISTTGVGGLSLGSGSGWLERYCGLTCDSLIEAEVVTADGRVVPAAPETRTRTCSGPSAAEAATSASSTQFRFRLHEVGPIVLGGMLLFPGDRAREVLALWRDLMLDAPDAMGSGVALITAPPADFVPEPARGQPAVGVIVCHAGPIAEGEQVVAPLREFGPPAVDLVQPMPYVAVQQLIDQGNPPGDAQLLERRLPGRAPRRGDRRVRLARPACAVADDPGHRGRRGRGAGPRRRGRHGVRPAAGAVQPAPASPCGRPIRRRTRSTSTGPGGCPRR